MSFQLMISKIDQLPLTQLGSLPRKEPASVRTETNIGFSVSAVSEVSVLKLFRHIAEMTHTIEGPIQ